MIGPDIHRTEVPDNGPTVHSATERKQEAEPNLENTEESDNSGHNRMTCLCNDCCGSIPLKPMPERR